MAAYSCRTNVIIEFYEKKVGTAEDQTSQVKHSEINGNLLIFMN